MAYNTIVYEKSEGIGTITLNRPKSMNALSSEVFREMAEVLELISADPDVRVVILTGSEKFFAAGADITEIRNISNATEAHAFLKKARAVFSGLEDSEKPVIAAVNGFALGGGCEIALSCHIRVASEGARFGQPEVKIGLLPGFGGSQRLPRLIGKGRALELLLTGGMIDAGEALRIGLVNKVVPAESLVETAMDIAGVIAANAPLAIEYCMAAVSSGLEMPLEEALRMEAALFGLCFASDDMREGTSAFLEKRPARFTGR